MLTTGLEGGEALACPAEPPSSDLSSSSTRTGTGTIFLP